MVHSKLLEYDWILIMPCILVLGFIVVLLSSLLLTGLLEIVIDIVGFGMFITGLCGVLAYFSGVIEMELEVG